MGLLAALGAVAEAVAVVALGVSVGIDGFLNLEPFGEEEEGRNEFLYVVGVGATLRRFFTFFYFFIMRSLFLGTRSFVQR